MQEKPAKNQATDKKQKDQEDDPVVSKAVDDISAKESDELLEAEDKELEKAFTGGPNKFSDKLINFIKEWWNNPKKRWATLIVTFVVVMAVSLVPASRYFVLNTLGARASASVVVVDDTTKLPLKNVQVTIANNITTTNSDGYARLSKLHLGPTTVKIEKRAFVSTSQKITLGWGSNKLGDNSLKADGAQYMLSVKDFLSDKPLAKVEALYGEANAISDADGKILLTIDTSGLADDQKMPVQLSAAGYRTDTLEVPVNATGATATVMVPARKDVFVSKRSGKYDLYKIDIDGKNEQLVLAGTGAERTDLTVVSHPSNEKAAYISTRDNIRNKDGFLLSSLDVIDLSDNSKFTIAQSEKIQIVGWQGDHLIYVEIAAGASATNPRRQRLISYDSKISVRQELASSNFFNDVTIAQGQIYYAPSSAFQNDQNARLFRVNPDGSNRQTILGQEVFNILRTNYDTFQISSQDWYEYKINSASLRKLSGQPADITNRVYVDSADDKHSLWSDQRDGKGVLLSLELASRTDKTLVTQSGLNVPYRWLNNSVAIYRVQTSQETADYAISIEGGGAHKIIDVTNTSGIDQWYYY